MRLHQCNDQRCLSVDCKNCMLNVTKIYLLSIPSVCISLLYTNNWLMLTFNAIPDLIFLSLENQGKKS